jgi:hypothetical protein
MNRPPLSHRRLRGPKRMLSNQGAGRSFVTKWWDGNISTKDLTNPTALVCDRDHTPSCVAGPEVIQTRLLAASSRIRCLLWRLRISKAAREGPETGGKRAFRGDTWRRAFRPIAPYAERSCSDRLTSIPVQGRGQLELPRGSEAAGLPWPAPLDAREQSGPHRTASAPNECRSSSLQSACASSARDRSRAARRRYSRAPGALAARLDPRRGRSYAIGDYPGHAARG